MARVAAAAMSKPSAGTAARLGRLIRRERSLPLSDQPRKKGSHKGGGASSGGPYPNPHTGKDKGRSEGKADGYMGHGGQSEMEYHGTGRLGEKKTGENPNAPAEEDDSSG